MHDIKFIKDNSSLFDEILKKGIFLLLKEILFLHQEYLDNLKKTQGLQEKKIHCQKCFLQN